ncbi:hypothetical protein ACM9HF_07070 [Colwellia sp. RE-S-Sl-9]
MKNSQIKNNYYVLCLLTFVLFSIAFTLIAAEDMDNVTMEIATKEAKYGHRIHMYSNDIISDYMIKKGDITVEEVKEKKRKRNLQREELKTLKQEGDREAFKARLMEIKAEHYIERKKLEEYINNNDELKQQLNEKRSKYRDKKANDMHDRHRKEKFFKRWDDNQERERHQYPHPQ